MLTYAESLRILGLNAGASEKEIKQAFRRLAQQCHPDKFPAGSVEQARATVKFRQIKEACDVLNAARSQPPQPPPRPGATGQTYTYGPTGQSYNYTRSRDARRPRYSGPYSSGPARPRRTSWVPDPNRRYYRPIHYSGCSTILPTGCMVWIAFVLLLNLARCAVEPRHPSRVTDPEIRKILERR